MWDMTGDRTVFFIGFRYFTKRATEVVTIVGFKTSTCLSFTVSVYSNERSLLSIYIS